MSRLLKILGLAVGVVVLLFVVVAVAVSLLFDPNDYKGDIATAVQNATGRELTLDGDLELALFPTIRIAVGAASLSNAPGFGDEPMMGGFAGSLDGGNQDGDEQPDDEQHREEFQQRETCSSPSRRHEAAP